MTWVGAGPAQRAQRWGVPPPGGSQRRHQPPPVPGHGRGEPGSDVSKCRPRPVTSSRSAPSVTSANAQGSLKKIHGVAQRYAYKERRAKLYVCEECGGTADSQDAHLAHLRQRHPHSPLLAKLARKAAAAAAAAGGSGAGLGASGGAAAAVTAAPPQRLPNPGAPRMAPAP